MIQDITSKFIHKHEISWNKLITYEAIKKVDKSSHFFIFIEYQYMGNTGNILLHENCSFSFFSNSPILSPNLSPNHVNNRVRIISATLKINNGNNDKNETVIFEEDVSNVLTTFEGIYKNYHLDVIPLHLDDFLMYLVSIKKLSIDSIPYTSLEITDYQLNEFFYQNKDIITFH
jgi:hypothetical protein